MDVKQFQQSLVNMIQIIYDLYGEEREWDGIIELDMTNSMPEFVIRLAQKYNKGKYDYDVRLVILPLQALFVAETRLKEFIKENAKVL